MPIPAHASFGFYNALVVLLLSPGPEDMDDQNIGVWGMFSDDRFKRSDEPGGTRDLEDLKIQNNLREIPELGK